MKRLINCSLAICLCCVWNVSIHAAQWGMKNGTPEIKSAGHLAFGPEGVLFVGDAKSATIFAFDTGETEGNPNEVDLHVHAIDGEIAKLVQNEKVQINDMVINPRSGSAYISVTYGESTPGIVKVAPNGELELMAMSDVNFSKVDLPNPPVDGESGEGRRRRNYRDEAITDLAFSDNRLLVSGRSGDKAASNVREIIFPFAAADKGTSLEIYHAAHGQFEDNAVVKTFVPFQIDGEPHLLAGFTCTPLVKFPLQAVKAGGQVKGTTVAELGNRNQPLDMIVYEQDGKDYLLMTNSARGVMKVSTEDIERQEGLTEPVRGGGTAGQTFETVESMQGVVQMDRLNDGHVAVISKNDENSLDLHSVELP